MLEARVKQGTVIYPVTACSGLAEFVRSEWRVVPAGFEAEVQANPLLESREYEAKSMEEALPVLRSMAKERNVKKVKEPAPVDKGEGGDDVQL